MRLPTWSWIVAGALALLGLLFFFQTKDPMVLIFAIMASGMLFFALVVVDVLRGGIGGVRVKCAACGGLNLEAAKFCSQCGRPL